METKMQLPNYRETTRGGQDFIQPLVGTGWTPAQLKHLMKHFRDNGYFVAYISPGRLALTKIST